MNTPSPVPLFSVVVPLYNKAQHITRTLQSVFAQTCQDFEIVVVDDGSTDRSADVVNALEDPRLHLIQVPNGGVSAARNRGIAAAQGRWVAFLDADDWYHPSHLATLASAIRACPDANMVASGFRNIDEDKLASFLGWAAEPDQPLERITDLPSRWMYAAVFFTSSVAVQRAVLNAVQPCFVVGESHGEDLDLWFRLAEQGPVAYMPQATVARTWVAGSLTAQHKKIEVPPYLERLQQRARKGTLPPALCRSSLWFYNQQLLTMARQCCARGDRPAGLAMFKRTSAALGGRRWWVTLLMLYLLPAGAVSAFQRWRTLRRMDIH
jgi:glycosyltransferase involved in cell wall biosynthesis